ncbi:MAG: class I SAM-dependent RNA methyltransferase [Actinomycetota bacterium]
MDRRNRTKRHVERSERIIDIRVDKVVAEGDGLGRDATGKVVFVEGALPGERVSARIVSESKDYARAIAVDIIDRNQHRVTPACPYVAAGCGGCDLQHADEDLQMEIKKAIVTESLERLGRVHSPDVRVIRQAHSVRTLRTTVRVAAVGDRVGFRRRRSREVVPIETCLVAHPRINDIIAGLRLAPDAEAVLRVGTSSDESVIWVEPSEDLVSADGSSRTGSTATIREIIAGVEFVVSAGSFFQSSPGAADTLVDAVARAVGPSESWPEGIVIDAYGGVGLFAGTVVPRERRAVLIEASASSCADARVNLRHHDVEIFEGRVEEWSPVPAAVVIADPARDGLGAAAVDVLTRCEPAVFVLVSCDPASLGRDARLLEEAGYRLAYSEVLDVFPHTHHVETVSRFVRSPLDEVS